MGVEATQMNTLNNYQKMADMDEKKLAEWKQALAKSGITYETDEEYDEALKNLAGFFDVLIQIDLEQKRQSEGLSDTKLRQ